MLAIADAGLLPYDVAMDFTKSLISENHVVPWRQAAARLSVTDTLLRSTDASEPYKVTRTLNFAF